MFCPTVVIGGELTQTFDNKKKNQNQKDNQVNEISSQGFHMFAFTPGFM